MSQDRLKEMPMRCLKCGEQSLFDLDKCSRCGWLPGEAIATPPRARSKKKPKPKPKTKGGCTACSGKLAISNYFYHPQLIFLEYSELNMKVTERWYNPVPEVVRLCSECVAKRSLTYFGITAAILAGSMLLMLIGAATESWFLFVASLWGIGGGLYLFGHECLFASQEEKGDRLAGETSACESFKTRRGFLKLLQDRRNLS